MDNMQVREQEVNKEDSDESRTKCAKNKRTDCTKS